MDVRETPVFMSNHINEIAEILINGGIALLPTDTVYGLHALCSNNNAADLLCDLKKRPKEKHFITLISNVNQLKDLGYYDSNFDSLFTKYWPGPNTFIINGRSFRLPDNDFLRSLIDKVGPIYSTSANISGEEISKNLGGCVEVFGLAVDCYLIPSGPSTVLNNNPSSVYKVKEDFETLEQLR